MTAGIPNWMSIADVISVFRGFGGRLINSDGSLRALPGFRRFAREFDLEIEEVLLDGAAPSRGVPHVTTIDLGPEHFEPKLAHNHVLVTIGEGFFTGLSHTVVAYGADRFSVCYMNPLDPDTHHPCDHYSDFGAPAERYLMVWKKP